MTPRSWIGFSRPREATERDSTASEGVLSDDMREERKGGTQKAIMASFMSPTFHQ
jgi:hypothetical protein